MQISEYSLFLLQKLLAMHAAPDQGSSGDSCRPGHTCTRCFSNTWLWIKVAKTAAIVLVQKALTPHSFQQCLSSSSDKQLSTSCPQPSCTDAVELAFAELNSSIGHKATAESVAIQHCCIRGISACITKNAICSFSARLSHRKPQFPQKLQNVPNVNYPWHFDGDKRLNKVGTLVDKKVNERSALIGLSLPQVR